MTQGRKDSIHLFRVKGIDVYLHWAWLLVAFYQIANRTREYSSVAWNIVEYLTLFFIVLLHEFGHAFATRQVGGTAKQIMLWPLGGVAFVAPPQRPGAVLWSTAAGPLVNVALLVVLSVTALFEHTALEHTAMPDLHIFLRNVWVINCGLLIFNLLPIYPLDGGQILRALLWFPLGRARSLFVAAVIGFVGVAALAALAYYESSIWMGFVTYFVFLQCRRGLSQAQALRAREKLPRRAGFACVDCGAAPPIGALWGCHHCGATFDTFEAQAVCPNCRESFSTTQCLDCGALHPIAAWRTP